MMSFWSRSLLYVDIADSCNIRCLILGAVGSKASGWFDKGGNYAKFEDSFVKI